jgi:hypothetical protein
MTAFSFDAPEGVSYPVQSIQYDVLTMYIHYLKSSYFDFLTKIY